jgi:hypothetical protein
MAWARLAALRRRSDIHIVLVENSEAEKLFGRPSRRRDVVGLILPAQNQDKLREVVKTVIRCWEFTGCVRKC